MEGTNTATDPTETSPAGRSASLDARAARDVIEHCYEQGWTDGLPVVACTESILAEFLAATPRDPDEIVLSMPHLNRSCTVRSAAVSAVMAGCRPEYLPVVVAALESLATEGYAPTGLWQSTTGTAPTLLVNGPIVERLGINSRGNVFGSGFRANATIGRTMRLVWLNVFGIRPHELDQSTQATPSKYGSCIAEREDASPWAPFHTDFGFDAGESTVTALTTRSVIHIEARHTSVPEQLLRDIAGTIGRSGAMIHSTTSCCVVLGPEHAGMLGRAGWSKRDVQEFLFEEAVSTREALDQVGKGAVSAVTKWRLPADHPEAIDLTDDAPVDTGVRSRAYLDAQQGSNRVRADGAVRAFNSPDAVLVIVAGASNAGVSAVVETFGPRGGAPAITRIELSRATN
jgi:hypothetical protein